MEGKLAEKEESQHGFARLMKRIEREQTGFRQGVNQGKKTYFNNLTKAGLLLAEAIEADFEAQSNEYCGEIRLRVGLVYFGIPGDGRSGRDELALLTRMADYIVIIPKGDILEWKFGFQFNDAFSC